MAALTKPLPLKLFQLCRRHGRRAGEGRGRPSRGPRRRHSAAPAARKKQLSAATASALAFAAFMTAATAAIAARNAIVSFAPATAAVYADLGMPVNLRGLEIDARAGDG